MSPQELREVKLHEYRAIQAEVRSAQRGESLRALTGTLVPVIAVMANSPNRGPILIAAPLILAFLAVYQVNAAAHERCLRVMRNRLAGDLAHDFPDTFRDAEFQAARTPNLGVGAAVVLFVIAYAGLVGWGYDVNRGRLLLQLGSAALGLVAIATAVGSMVHTGRKAEQVFGADSENSQTEMGGASGAPQLNGGS